MAKFRATFFWTMSRTLLIEADTEEEAHEKAGAAGEGINVDKGGSYVSDSFELGSVEEIANETGE